MWAEISNALDVILYASWVPQQELFVIVPLYLPDGISAGNTVTWRAPQYACSSPSDSSVHAAVAAHGMCSLSGTCHIADWAPIE